MKVVFRESVLSLLPASESALLGHLGGLQPRDWQSLAELFAARLPDFDAVIAMPGAEALAAQVARMRGVPLWPAGEAGDPPPDRGLANPSGPGALLLTVHLGSGEPELAVVEQAAARGVAVRLLGAGVERTSQGARARLLEAGTQVRAAVQLADTPGGLTLERRTPDRWLGGHEPS